jgi:ribosomal protein S27E
MVLLARPFPSCFGELLPIGSLNFPAHEALGGKIFMAEGYCVKCKAKREIADGVEETMKNGRKAIKGKCPTCGTVMFKILGGKATPPAGPATPPATS